MPTSSPTTSRDTDADADAAVAAPVRRTPPDPGQAPQPQGHYALAVLLIVGGLLGLLASFSLTIDKFILLSDPGAALSCNVNSVVQCGTNLGSWQGAVFGFPNPLIGLVAFTAPVIVGVALLAKVSFPSWFWAVFNIGMLAGIAFVAWLASESLFALYTLCPWCALVYSVVIPMSLAVTLFNLRENNLRAGKRMAAVGATLYSWTPLLSLGCYLIVAVVAQVQLDLLGQF
jgi:uncharacterized membrane protein